MTQTLVTVLVFVVLLALLPAGIRWLQARSLVGPAITGAASKVVSAIAVGPQQRVVTVEVGPPDARIFLVLGVTPQSITCLHSLASRTAGTAIADNRDAAASGRAS